MLLTCVFMSKVTQKGMKVGLITLRKKSPYSGLFWSAFFPHFPAFGPNMERMQTRITPNTETFYAV